MAWDGKVVEERGEKRESYEGARNGNA